MSRRAHIAMIGVPAVSHVLPSLEVIRELVDRGHRVTYANDRAVEELVTGVGAEFVPYVSGLPVADNDWPADPIAAMDVFLDDNIRMLPQLRAVYETDPADLYLYDIGSYAARALAEAQRRPVVQLSPTFVAWSGYQEEVGAQLKNLPGATGHLAKFADWLADSGATTTDVDTFAGRPPRVVATISEAMQPNADRVDSGTVTFVGPCPGRRAERESWPRPAGAERLLLVSLGSAATRRPDFYRRCLAAFGDLPGWHVVLQIGKYTDPEVLGPLPANVETHPWVPQLAVLEQADAFVTHAGMGGCGEGLYTSVPMIAVPGNSEQVMNADRLAELGVARHLDPEADAETLRSALLELTGDPEVAANCARLRARARAEGGAERAATLLEEVLRG
ncbi:glycosyl transferase [Streptomyces sp. AJS327]|uniref:macrolide family glycosyltransferase n=1 Tax=Streptomyces sp. AJS327 TaxID=2545265 RepID=UPI0015DE2936|nr:macrolide family glycosyltransferase [Streptomyces sp. AJS327]MBA0049876.1 glycosyl transferase [Streptomyces sp. AJS327]